LLTILETTSLIGGETADQVIAKTERSFVSR
jgi:hypothetical protein